MAYIKTFWVNSSKPYIDAGNLNKIENGVESASAQADINAQNISLKANTADTYTKTEVDRSLELKADKAYVDSQDLLKADKIEVDTSLGLKADKTEVYFDGAGAHNSIYRGKYLGTSVTTAQYANIANGTFADLYVGDYWTIGGVNWRIAAFNYYTNTGDSLVPGNHLVIVPDTALYSQIMNDTATTEGGYIGSKMYTEGLEQAKTIINNAFSGHIVTFRAYLSNATINGAASSGAWVDSTVDLMNEVMVYGSIINGHSTFGLYNIGTEKSQLPLFKLNPQSINTRYYYWLRDVASVACFAFVDAHGGARHDAASYSLAVRPRFLIS